MNSLHLFKRRPGFYVLTVFSFLLGCTESGEVIIHDNSEYNPGYHIFSDGTPEARAWIKLGETYNREAPIPSQCYTVTDGQSNPCYVCHQSYPFNERRANSQSDGYLQGLYEFSSKGETNHWINLFKDRSAYIETVSNEQILEYINQDNYTNLIDWMKTGEWTGHIPEIENLALGAAAFDEYGLALDGSRWVAFNYKPLPSTFWPTNGATDDVMIKLPNAFSEINGEFSRDLYFANLSLLEMAITGASSLETPGLNEAQIDTDLDDDGVFSVSTSEIQRRDSYLGDASDVPLVDMLYPQGTAFLHSVRYIGVDGSGNISVAPRMKELRYMVKEKFIPPENIPTIYYFERKEKHDEKLPKVSDYGDRGMSNKHGWMLWGFIEDQHGDLRKQTNEEQLFCMGCHKSIGTTIDHSFAFPRKAPGVQGWGYIDLRKLVDAPSLNEEKGEYLSYLERVGGGDEFRANNEMLARWFLEDGSVDELAVTSVDSIYELITPSRDRALALNKAYKAIVEEQSYIYGRDTVIGAVENVLREVDREVAPLLPENQFKWDIRLDWSEKGSEMQSYFERYSHYIQ